MTDEAKATERAKDREAKRLSRVLRDIEDIETDNTDMKERVNRLREGKSRAELEFNRIDKKHLMRERRKLRDGKTHLLDNQKARKGMSLLRTEGGLKEFSRRKGRQSDKMRDWDIFFRGCQNNADQLEVKKPDIVHVIKERIREENEKKRNSKRRCW